MLSNQDADDDSYDEDYQDEEEEEEEESEELNSEEELARRLDFRSQLQEAERRSTQVKRVPMDASAASAPSAGGQAALDKANGTIKA